MKEYYYTKLLARVVSLLTVILAVGYGVFAFIGISLSNLWSVKEHTSASQYAFVFAFFVMILILGLFTLIGSLKLTYKTWSKVYIGILTLIGVGFIIAFFVSFGALGIKVEIFLLFIGLLYVNLGYMTYKKK